MTTYRQAIPSLTVIWTGVVDGHKRAIIEDGTLIWDTDYRAYRDRLAEQAAAGDVSDVYAEFCEPLPYHGRDNPTLHRAIMDAYAADTGEDIGAWAWS